MKKYKYLLMEAKAKFLGTCDRVRKTQEGEKLWQDMMHSKKEIRESEFLKIVNVKDILDEGESWNEYKQNAKQQGDPIKYYKSDNNIYFFQTAGFEFMWRK